MTTATLTWIGASFGPGASVVVAIALVCLLLASRAFLGESLLLPGRREA